MDSDDEREENLQYKGVPATIILINGYNINNATVAYDAVCRMVRQYLRVSSNNYLSVCFYGVKNPNASNIGLQDMIEVFPLSVPTLNDFKKLLNLKVSTFEKTTDLKLSDALWHCSKTFSNCKKQLLSRTVIIMSKLDVPPVQSDQKLTFTRVGDFANVPIEIKIVNIADEKYGVDPFYEDFAVDAYITVPEPVWNCKEIEKIIYQQSHRHVAVAQLSFEISSGFDIGVGVYKLLKSTNTSMKSENLDRETNAVVTTVNKVMKVSIETNESRAGPSIEPMETDNNENEQRSVPLLKSEVIYYQEYGGERIEFTDNEKKAIDNPFGPPMMKLLGFKPASLMCKEKWFLKPGYFLYPSENIIEGSTVAFKALHQACVESSVVAICILCTRVNSKPNIVALFPCSHPLGLNVELGFDVIHIPFVENVRSLPTMEDNDDNTEVSKEHKTAIKDIITSIKFDYKPDIFENPKTQVHYRNIEAIALSEENTENFVDTTKPSVEKFQNLKEDLFEELFGPFGEVKMLKRVAKAPGPKDDTKRSRNENIDASLLQTRIESNQVMKYTVDELKQILRSKDIPELPALTGLKKANLVDLVYKHITV